MSGLSALTSNRTHNVVLIEDIRRLVMMVSSQRDLWANVMKRPRKWKLWTDLRSAANRNAEV